MKLFTFFATSVLLLFFMATCSSTTQKDTMEVTGIIEPQGITSYQYGTHTISKGDVFYALRSDTIDLDQHLGKEVTIIAEKIEGYPLEGGPEYLLVLKIK